MSLILNLTSYVNIISSPATNGCGETMPSFPFLISNGDTVAEEEEKSSAPCCFVHVYNRGYASLNSLRVSYSCLIDIGSTSNPTTLTKSVSKSLWKRIVNRTWLFTKISSSVWYPTGNPLSYVLYYSPVCESMFYFAMATGRLSKIIFTRYSSSMIAFNLSVSSDDNGSILQSTLQLSSVRICI